MTVLERFMEKFTVKPETGCWLWTAACNPDGYGNFYINGSTIGAHRVSYEIHIGEIPRGIHVLHTCDVTNCVQPGHLYLGTHAYNMADMARRDRAHASRNAGCKNASARLGPGDVLSICDSSKKGIDLAEDYGISGSLVSMIKSKKVWAHI